MFSHKVKCHVFMSWSNKAPLMSIPLDTRFYYVELESGFRICFLHFWNIPKTCSSAEYKVFFQRNCVWSNDCVKFVSLYFKSSITAWCVMSSPVSDLKYFGQWLFIILPHFFFFFFPYCWSYFGYFLNPARVRKMQLVIQNA